MESTGDNDHQHCKQWPINIPWQVVKCEKIKVGVGQGFEGLYASMCVRACTCLCVCIHMCESVRQREAVTWGETVLQSSREMVRKISPWGWCGGPTRYLWKQMSPVGRSSDMPQLILRVLFPCFLSIFPCFLSILPFLVPLRWVFYLCFVLSDHLQKWGPGMSGGERFIHTHLFLLFNENSHSMQETAKTRLVIVQV